MRTQELSQPQNLRMLHTLVRTVLWARAVTIWRGIPWQARSLHTYTRTLRKLPLAFFLERGQGRVVAVVVAVVVAALSRLRNVLVFLMLSCVLVQWSRYHRGEAVFLDASYPALRSCLNQAVSHPLHETGSPVRVPVWASEQLRLQGRRETRCKKKKKKALGR